MSNAAETPNDKQLRYLKYLNSRRTGEPVERFAAKCNLGSSAALYRALRHDGFPVCERCGGYAKDVKCIQCKRKAKGGTDGVSSLPPAQRTQELFRAALKRLDSHAEALPLRVEHRQDGRFVGAYKQPFTQKTSAGFGYIVDPPDARGSYTLAESYSLIASGASAYPDDPLTALISAALLSGASVDELLESLHPDPTDEVRDEILKRLDGKDGLRDRARQIAALMRGRDKVGKGRLPEGISEEEHTAAWYITDCRRHGVPDDEIRCRLSENPAFLQSLKETRAVKMEDVQRLVHDQATFWEIERCS